MKTRLKCIVLLAAAFSLSTPARANVFDQVNNTLDHLYGTLADFSPDQIYNVRVGIGPSLDPHFRGDSSVYLHAVPLISLQYRDLVAVDNNHVRVNFLGTWGNVAGNSHWSAGPVIHIDFGRDESDSPKLKGLGDVGTSFELGAYVGYRTGPWRFRVRMRQDVANGHHGMIVDSQAARVLASGTRWTISGNMEITWASGSYMNAFYGVTPAQSAASGLPVYRARAGLHDLAFNFVGTYKIDQKWSLLGTMGLSRLLNSAADNPLVEQRGSPNQAQVAAFVIYSF